MGLIQEFRKFAMRGNLVDLMVGFTVGAAFTTIAKSLVNDIVMPPIGLVLGKSDFTDLFVVLREGDKITGPYETLAAAQGAGAVTINYGVFINNLVSFLLVSFVVFLIVRGINRLEDSLESQFGDPPQPGEPTEKKCPFCRTTIPAKAARCPACTSHLEGESPANPHA
ncbi:MAG: large conductance mechanosensitive channel protein MscL [Planctomycetaceae bacterium]|nr:large conductance mechanosensitive channel protein MscL [Planctomycetaceae bacterium]